MRKISIAKLIHTTNVAQKEEDTKEKRGTDEMTKKRWAWRESGQGVFILLCLLHTAFFLILAAFCTLWQVGGQALGRDKVSGYGSTTKQEGEKEEIKKVNKRKTVTLQANRQVCYRCSQRREEKKRERGRSVCLWRQRSHSRVGCQMQIKTAITEVNNCLFSYEHSQNVWTFTDTVPALLTFVQSSIRRVYFFRSANKNKNPAGIQD